MDRIHSVDINHSFPIWKLFINSVEKTLYESDLTKEGERAIDQIKLKVPKVVNPAVNQEVKYLQDMVDSKLVLKRFL